MNSEQTPIKQNSHAARRKYHIIYKTTCTVTNKFYYGMHSTDDLNDGYVGSGQVLSRSIKKYGKEAHICEVMEFLPTRQALSDREKEILTTELRRDPMCMNIMPGGLGNYPGRPTSEETRAKLSAAGKGRVFTEEHKARISEGNTGKKRAPEVIANWREKNVGRKQSEEEIEKRKMSNRLTKARAVIVDGVEYMDKRAAAEALGMSKSTLDKRLASKYFSNMFYKDSPKEHVEKVAPCSKSVIVDGVEYANITRAAEAHGMSVKMVHTRCGSDKYPEWQFV